MVKARQYLPFVLEAMKHKTRVLARTYQLDGDFFAVFIVGPDSAVDFTHSASADFFDELIGTDPVPNPGLNLLRKVKGELS